MNTFLFAWNPNKWNWTNLNECIENIKNSGRATHKWSCVSHRKIKIGDRAFLVKLGVEPKGIMGSGIVISEPFLSQHWSGENKLVPRVLIEFDTLLNSKIEPLLDLDVLNHGKLSKQMWTPQSSGISIKSELTDTLESIWFNFLNNENTNNRFDMGTVKTSFTEGISTNVSITRYERNQYARQVCLSHYGLTCIICGFNFENYYGKAGKDFIHVHHLHEISKQKDKHKVDPIADLRPVCPNCHSIIHRRNPPYSIDEMKKMISLNKSAT